MSCLILKQSLQASRRSVLPTKFGLSQFHPALLTFHNYELALPFMLLQLFLQEGLTASLALDLFMEV